MNRDEKHLKIYKLHHEDTVFLRIIRQGIVFQNVHHDWKDGNLLIHVLCLHTEGQVRSKGKHIQHLQLTCTVSNCLQSGIRPQSVKIIFYFICTETEKKKKKKGGGEGEGGVSKSVYHPNQQTLTMRPLRRRYGESNKGTTVHRSAPQLCSACLMNAIIWARQ